MLNTKGVKNNIIQSMSKKEKFIDNGSIENFGPLMAEMLFGGKFEPTDGVIYRLNSAYFIETTIESLSKKK